MRIQTHVIVCVKYSPYLPNIYQNPNVLIIYFKLRVEVHENPSGSYWIYAGRYAVSDTGGFTNCFLGCDKETLCLMCPTVNGIMCSGFT
jgi:hypothetical protein